MNDIGRQRLGQVRIAADLGEQDAEGDDGAALWRPLEAARADVRSLLRRPIAEQAKWECGRSTVRGVADLAARPAGKEGEDPPSKA